MQPEHARFLIYFLCHRHRCCLLRTSYVTLSPGSRYYSSACSVYIRDIYEPFTYFILVQGILCLKSLRISALEKRSKVEGLMSIYSEQSTWSVQAKLIILSLQIATATPPSGSSSAISVKIQKYVIVHAQVCSGKMIIPSPCAKNL